MLKRFVDSHIHFWQPDQLRYSWLAELPSLNRPYLPGDLAQAAAKLPLKKIVFVQADCLPDDGLREVAWVSDLAQVEPRIQGIVAFAPLEQGTDSLRHLSTLQHNPLVKGVRRLIQAEAVSFATRPDFVRGVQALEEYDLSFDVCIRFDQLEAVIELVQQCPAVRFVLDHCGKPPIKARLVDRWAVHLMDLAKLPNVFCKLSGLVTEADWESWTPAALQPYVDQAVMAFGPGRLMFGGDWPVVELASDYDRWVTTAISALNSLAETEKDRVFYTTACEFYRLPVD